MTATHCGLHNRPGRKPSRLEKPKSTVGGSLIDFGGGGPSELSRGLPRHAALEAVVNVTQRGSFQAKKSKGQTASATVDDSKAGELRVDNKVEALEGQDKIEVTDHRPAANQSKTDESKQPSDPRGAAP